MKIGNTAKVTKVKPAVKKTVAKSTTAKKTTNTTKSKGTTAAPVIDVDGAAATAILKKLKTSKKGKTATELGTTPPVMQALEKAGKVKRNGTKPTGQRGRPPIMWVLA